MKKLYDRNEVTFAVIWIVIYCVLSVPIRGKYGDESPLMLIALAAVAIAATIFIRRYGLEEKYGLTGWPKDSKIYWFFIPMWILSTGNLWNGFKLSYSGIYQIMAVMSMLLIGYIEEIIFRGFLFKGMLKRDGVRASIIVSAVTFGIGHIVNLLAGQANLQTVIQVIFAISWGFIFTMSFYKSGSLIPGIIVHSLVDAFSKFGNLNYTVEIVYMIATIVTAIIYCTYLAKLPEKACSQSG